MPVWWGRKQESTGKLFRSPQSPETSLPHFHQKVKGKICIHIQISAKRAQLPPKQQLRDQQRNGLLNAEDAKDAK